MEEDFSEIGPLFSSQVDADDRASGEILLPEVYRSIHLFKRTGGE